MDAFVKEMNELKAENARIIDMQMISNKKLIKMESENEELKNENVKYRVKLESLQKGIFQNEVVIFISFEEISNEIYRLKRKSIKKKKN